MADDHNIGSEAEFLAWIEAQLSRLDADEQAKPDILGDPYYYMYDDAQRIAVRLGLHEALEALGARPPDYAFGSHQKSLSAIRGQIQAKFLRVKSLLAPSHSRPIKATSVAVFARRLAERIAQLPHKIVESFELPMPKERVQRIRELTGEISADAFPLITWIERNRPLAADLEKRRLFLLQDDAARCAGMDIPEYAGGLVNRQDGAPMSAGVEATAAFLVFCLMFSKAILAWAEEIESAEKQQVVKPVSEGPWSEPDTPSRWAKRFGMSWDTLKRRFDDGTIRAKKLSIKSYQVHVEDVPSDPKSA